MSRIEKWVCGVSTNNKFVVRQVFVTETPQKFIVDREDAEISRLCGYRTHIRKSENLLFTSASEAVQDQIWRTEGTIKQLQAKIDAAQQHLKELEVLKHPR